MARSWACLSGRAASGKAVGTVEANVQTSGSGVLIAFFDDDNWQTIVDSDYNCVTAMGATPAQGLFVRNGTMEITPNGFDHVFPIYEKEKPRFWCVLFPAASFPRSLLVRSSPSRALGFDSPSFVGVVCVNGDSRYVAVAASDCSTDIEIDGYTLTFLNDGSQLGYDEIGVPTMYAVALGIWIVALVVAVREIFCHAPFAPRTLAGFFCALILQILASLFLLIHWQVYASDGNGSDFIEGVGRFCHVASQSLLWLVAAFIACGALRVRFGSGSGSRSCSSSNACSSACSSSWLVFLCSVCLGSLGWAEGLFCSCPSLRASFATRSRWAQG